ncbi:M16 family metallopeptidase [Lactobacillus sp. PV012]|uniref:M16 family metallopeptidase n=1 Tax=Lactobacillus sp. PV012 TaxID=2594494 RepID=UPI00223F8DB9|nr:pitrilysin family protein [Lactobacillus sp. PV012]QNQ82576.1 insulinase family protein [Lactobacillus sp. PV012]
MKKLDTIKKSFSSGFEAQIILRHHFVKKFMGIIVDFGGSDPQKLAGGAHFLEHKLFAKKHGDISHRFEELGANTNAFTSYNETMYFANFIDHSLQVTNLLFELVGTTYFTKENVQKEAEIIAQELAMYQEDPNWELQHQVLEMMFPQTNLALDLTGTQQSLSEMTPQILQEIYEEHYFAGNMKFVACGGFTKAEVREILEEVDKLQKKYLRPQSRPLPQIKPAISKEETQLEIPAEVISARVCIGIKLPDFKLFDSSNELMETIVEAYLEQNLGLMSKGFEKFQKDKLLNSPLAIKVNYTREGNFALISGMSPKPEELIEEIKKLIFNGKGDQALFEIQKKEYIAEMKRKLDQIEELAIESAEMMLEKEDLLKLVQRFGNLSFNDFANYYNEIVDKVEIFSAIMR